MPPTPDEMTLTPTASVDSFVSAFAMRLDRALHVGLEDDLDLLDVARLDLVEDVLERDAVGRAGELLLAALVVPVLDERLGGLLVVDDVEELARVGDAVEAEDLDGRRRAGLGDGLALVAQHGADLARVLARDEQVAELERALLDEDRRDRAARAIEARLDDVALGRPCSGWPCSSSTSACSASISSSLSTPSFVFAETLHEDRVAAPLFRDEAVLGELVADAVGVGARLVDLVDGDDDRDARLLGVVDGLDRLRHRAVVGGDDEHDDVGHLRAARAHGGERLVAGRVEEDDVAAVARDLVGADVLRDAAGLARRRRWPCGWRRAATSCRGRRGP